MEVVVGGAKNPPFWQQVKDAVPKPISGPDAGIALLGNEKSN